MHCSGQHLLLGYGLDGPVAIHSLHILTISLPATRSEMNHKQSRQFWISGIRAWCVHLWTLRVPGGSHITQIHVSLHFVILPAIKTIFITAIVTLPTCLLLPQIQLAIQESIAMIALLLPPATGMSARLHLHLCISASPDGPAPTRPSTA